MKTETLVPPPHHIASLVEQEVRNRTSGRIRGLKVQVSEGNVVITGQTKTYYAKQLVTHAALDTTDQLVVKNEVEVCGR